jgi:hypothetical protein
VGSFRPLFLHDYRRISCGLQCATAAWQSLWPEPSA